MLEMQFTIMGTTQGALQQLDRKSTASQAVLSWLLLGDSLIWAACGNDTSPCRLLLLSKTVQKVSFKFWSWSLQLV